MSTFHRIRGLVVPPPGLSSSAFKKRQICTFIRRNARTEPRGDTEGHRNGKIPAAEPASFGGFYVIFFHTHTQPRICGRSLWKCVYVCVCVFPVCVCCVFELGSLFLFFFNRLPPAPPLSRYEAFAGPPAPLSPQSCKSRTIASHDTHAVAHTYEAHGRLHTRTRTQRVHFYFWLAVTAPVCCLYVFPRTGFN